MDRVTDYLAQGEPNYDEGDRILIGVYVKVRGVWEVLVKVNAAIWWKIKRGVGTQGRLWITSAISLPYRWKVRERSRLD